MTYQKPGNDDKLSRASVARVAFLWGSRVENIYLSRAHTISPRQKHELKKAEHLGFALTFGMLPTLLVGYFIIPEAVCYSASALKVPTPPFAVLGTIGFSFVFTGTRLFPIRNAKRKILKKYGDGGKAIRSLQMKCYAAGLAVCCAYSPLKQVIVERVEPAIESITRHKPPPRRNVLIKPSANAHPYFK